jgi:isoquinoline 1-oxidoreductase beta subunit
MNFFANVTDERVELAGPIQTPKWTAERISKELGRDMKDITLEMTRMGGGFGRRLYGDFAIEAAIISDKVRKPVQVVFSREDDMADGIYRPGIKYRISAAIKDNKIVGYHLKEAAINSNMYDLIPNFFPAGAIENYQVDVAAYKSNITTGAWRAPYTNFLAFAEQSFFDELADIMGVDRVKMRLDLLQKVKGTTDEKIQYSPERMEKVINDVVEKSNWGNPKKGVYQGFSAYYCHNTHVAEVAEVKMENGIPVVKKVICVLDCGVVINPTGAINQVEGGVIDGIGHAMYGNMTFIKGKPQALNFDSYRLIRISETPKVEVHFVQNDIAPTGLGEPALPPAGGAIANAMKAATGIRLYKQPFIENKDIFGLNV